MTNSTCFLSLIACTRVCWMRNDHPASRERTDDGYCAT